MSAGRVPRVRARGGRLDRRLPASGSSRCQCCRRSSRVPSGPRCRPTRPSTASRSRRAARPRRGAAAGHHPLAAPVVLRLLPGQHQRSGDPRRPARLRPRRAGHVVGDLAGRHRTGDPRAGLAGRAARAAGPVPVQRRGRRRHPAHRLRRARSSRCSPRCTGPAAAAPSGTASAAGRYTVYTSTQTHSSVEKACRIAGLGADALRKIDVDPRDAGRAAGAPARTARARRRRRLHPDAGRRLGRRPPAPAPSTRSREFAAIAHAARRVAARRRRVGRRRRGRTRAALAQRRTSTPPTPTAPTRTSGCSPTSTAARSGWPTGRR